MRLIDALFPLPTDMNLMMEAKERATHLVLQNLKRPLAFECTSHMLVGCNHCEKQYGDKFHLTRQHLTLERYKSLPNLPDNQ